MRKLFIEQYLRNRLGKRECVKSHSRNYPKPKKLASDRQD